MSESQKWWLECGTCAYTKGVMVAISVPGQMPDLPPTIRRPCPKCGAIDWHQLPRSTV